jgi:integrase
MAKLTIRTVEALEAKASLYIAWDDDLPGFGVCVAPSGRKTFVIQYRALGRSRRQTLGRFGTVTPDDARRRAKVALGSVAGGADPAAEARLARKASTVRDLAKRFYADHVAHRCKPSTQAEYKRCLDLFIVPKIGTYRIPAVTRADIADLHTGLAGKPYQANRVLGVLSKMFNCAEAWGLRPDGTNPSRHVRKYAEEKRKRYLSREEFERLEATLSGFDGRSPYWTNACAAIRLLMFTGCRLGEIQSLQWAFVRDGGLHLPDSKTGAKVVHLNARASAVLGLHKREAGNPYVIAGMVEGQPLTDLQKPWRAIRKAAGLSDVRIHDLRHSFASAAVAQGLSLPIIGRLLGHSSTQTTARYAHLADEVTRAATEATGEAIASAMGLAGFRVPLAANAA